jgi:transcription elongation factor GreA
MLSLSSVQLGSRVLLQDDDQKLEYMVVDPLEADPSEGKISHESPLGRALLGKVVNSWVKVVAPRRSLKYRILGIR